MREAFVSVMKVEYPGRSRKLIFTVLPAQRVQAHSAQAIPVWMEILRAISSSSQSVVVVPSATLPKRGVTPAEYSNDDTSCVFPVPPWPTMPTFLMSLVGYIFMTNLRVGVTKRGHRAMVRRARKQARACAW